MGFYILRRILHSIPILFGVTLIVFTLFNVVGGDPAMIIVGKHATAETIASVRHELGLDRSLPAQFLDYLGQVVTFDFGRSYRSKEEITSMVVRGMAPSFALGSLGFALTLVFSLSTALLVAYFRGKWIDRMVSILCVAGMSISSLAVILFAQYFFASELNWFPISGYESGFPGMYQYLFLPALIWTMVGVGPQVRYFRTAILDEASQDYVRTARAKGLSEQVVYFKHVLKNSMIPVLTFVVIEIPLLVLGALLLENYFGIPGLGSLTIDAFNNGDFPVMKAMTTIVSILMIIGNLLTDICYTLVDPRV
jgi:peptide/nickel transport system permease protein